jgi:hypothetical protein
MSGADWDWLFLDAADGVLDHPVSPAFTSRFDAEEWIGENWHHLAEQGVAAVRLVHLGEPVIPALPLRTG